MKKNSGAEPHRADSDKPQPAGTAIYRISKLFRTTNPRLRARLVRAAGLYRQYGSFLNRIMQDKDPRVRANLIESLWAMDGTLTRDILRAALRDSNLRVRTNALLGLHYLGEPIAADALIHQAGSPQSADRMAAVWAMGQAGNECFRAILTALSTEDPEEAVRDRARVELSRLPAPDASAEPPLPDSS